MNKPQKTIGVFAPSSWVEQSDIQAAQNFITAQGFTVQIHDQTYLRHHQSAGTHENKLRAFYDLWDNPDIDIIWAAGGGNRCLHWIDAIDYMHLKSDKTVIGFSDVTALLNALYAYNKGRPIHGPTFNRLHKTKRAMHIVPLLNGEKFSCTLEGAKILQEGHAKGPLIGGNLSLFQYLPQTLPGKFWEGSILFLEDCNEELSRIDRMLLHLKNLGVLQAISGLIMGDFGELPETGKPFGFTLEDIIREHVHGLDIPAVMTAPFGHGDILEPFPLIKTTEFNTSDLILRQQ
ncbi:MAG: LD-carboxypeptidase [Alphaproteobacteria bacterium]